MAPRGLIHGTIAHARAPALAALPAAALLRRAARVLPWALGAATLGLALFLRLYRLDGLITYYPDTYAQLRAVEHLLSGQLPVSYHYPPGVALVMAPVFAFLPRTLETMQAAILTAGVALVGVAYLATLAAGRDRRAAFFCAAAVAIGSTFVFHSRVGWFDVINTLLIACALTLGPSVARRGTPVLLAYGVLVFTMATVRYTNVIVLPALFLASLPPTTGRAWPGAALAHLRSRAVLTVALLVSGLYAAYLATAGEGVARFTNSNAGGVLDLGGYLPRLGRYLQASLLGFNEAWTWQDGAAALGVLALAGVGVSKLRRTNPSMAAAAAYLIAVWLPVHALYMIFDARYAMPAFFVLLVLAALGLSASVDRLRDFSHGWQRVGMVAVLSMFLALFAGGQLARDIGFLEQWPAEVARNRERAYAPLRDELRTVDGASSVLLSSQALALDRANPAITTYDLIPHSGTYGINVRSIDRLLAYVREQQAAGRTVYYHYTEYEDVRSSLRRYELGFDAYFDALRAAFSLTEVARASERPQRLYLVQPPPP